MYLLVFLDYYILILDGASLTSIPFPTHKYKQSKGRFQYKYECDCFRQRVSAFVYIQLLSSHMNEDKSTHGLTDHITYVKQYIKFKAHVTANAIENIGYKKSIFLNMLKHFSLNDFHLAEIQNKNYLEPRVFCKDVVISIVKSYRNKNYCCHDYFSPPLKSTYYTEIY